MFNAPGKRGRKYAEDLRGVVDAMLYIAQNWVPVALFARVVRTLDPGVVAVPPLVAQRHLGLGTHGAARGRT